MNQICKVCGEPAAGFHFGAFTCEGCKSFFGRSYNNLSSISECKNNGKCIIDKKNRTTCKACRLRKCYTVGMSKGGSRYGRRSNWFKIHCLLQEQQQQAEAAGNATNNGGISTGSGGFGDMAAAAAAAVAQQHMQRNSHLVAAQHMGGFLGYPSYLSEMMQTCPPFVSASASERRSADAANPNNIPFMNMMNSLPIAPPQHNFHLPTHLLFPGYHNTVSGATTPVCHSEMFKHRQSVESIASGDSIQRYSPAMRSSSTTTDDDRLSSVTSQSPELCVAEEIPTPLKHTIHTPIAVRAIPKDNTDDDALPYQPSSLEKCAKKSLISPIQSDQTTVESIEAQTQAQSSTLDASKTRDSDDIMVQDTPIDLSMKAVRSPDNSHYAIAGTSDDTQATISDSSDEDLYQTHHMDMRRKFCQFNNEQESNSASESSHEGIKRQRLTPTNFNSFTHNAPVTSLRGIFVCV